MSDKLTKAKMDLIFNEPFFTSIMLRHEFIETEEMDTIATNGRQMIYNSAFVESLDHDQLKGLLVHEILHVTNLHHTRKGNRDHELWNVACDYAINPVVIEAGFKLPDGALLEKRFKGMTAESIYAVLLEDIQQQQEQSGSCGGAASGGENEGEEGQSKKQQPGQVYDLPSESGGKANETEIKIHESELKQDIINAINAEKKKRGIVPDFMQRILEEIVQPKISWKEALNAYFQEINRNDYTWARKNTRYNSFFMPSLHKIECDNIVVAIDTSGSIDSKMITDFIAEVTEINSISKSITLVYCDAKVHTFETIESGDSIPKPIGGGWTDFEPVFKAVEESGIEPPVLIYLTDGECDSFGNEPEYPVIWVLSEKNESFKPPFADEIFVL